MLCMYKICQGVKAELKLVIRKCNLEEGKKMWSDSFYLLCRKIDEMF